MNKKSIKLTQVRQTLQKKTLIDTDEEKTMQIINGTLHKMHVHLCVFASTIFVPESLRSVHFNCLSLDINMINQ